VSNNSTLRLKQLQTACDTKLIIITTYQSNIAYKIEKVIHRLWHHKKYEDDDFRYLEGEWFYLNPEDVSDFKSTCEKIESNLILVKKMEDRPNRFVSP
jgi:hypothetical protein